MKQQLYCHQWKPQRCSAQNLRNSYPKILPTAAAHVALPSSRILALIARRPAAASPGTKMTSLGQQVWNKAASVRCSSLTSAALAFFFPAAAAALAWPSVATAAAASAAAPAVTAAPVMSGLGGILIGAGACVAAVAFSVLVFFTIPTLMAIRRAAVAVALLSRTVEAELPDTAAAMRLSSLEVTDALGELSLLGSDLTRGMRASARGIQATQHALISSGEAALAAASGTLLPAARAQAPGVRDAAQAVLLERARLRQPHPDLPAAARNAAHVAKQARALMAASTLATKASALTGLLRSRAQQMSTPKAASGGGDSKKGNPVVSMLHL